MTDYKAASKIPRAHRCENIDVVDGKPYPVLMQTSIFQEGGLALGINAEDMSFVPI